MGLKVGDRPLVVLSNVKGTFRRRSPEGVYDKSILCRDCENVFQKLDNYGHKILILDEDKQEKIIDGLLTIGYRIANVDSELLKLFFISILWRASISTQDFFSEIRLGIKLERLAKEVLWGERVCEKDEFSFVLAKFDEGLAARTMLNPHKERWFSVTYYRFYIYGYILYIKADSQKTPIEWEKFISTDKIVHIVSRGIMENAKEFPMLLDALSMNEKSSSG